jgi:hypothetical protein
MFAKRQTWTDSLDKRPKRKKMDITAINFIQNFIEYSSDGLHSSDTGEKMGVQ